MNTVKLIEKALEDQGRKKVWLANKLGKSQSQLSHWFSGLKPIPEESEKKALEILDIKIPIDCSEYEDPSLDCNDCTS